MNEIFEQETASGQTADREFDVQTDMTDVEIFNVTGTYIFARGKRFGRYWLLKGLPKEKRESSSCLRRLQEEFNLRSSLIHPGLGLAVAFEEIRGIGPCIVEEWVEGPSLADLLRDGKARKSERHRIIHELLATLEYLDQNGVKNISFSTDGIRLRDIDGQTVLTDFDTSAAGRFNSLAMTIHELCPEYSGIVEKWQHGSEKKGRHMADLQKALRRRERRPVILLRLMATVTAALIVAMTGFKINTMAHANEAAKEEIACLSRIHGRDQNRLTVLDDSLKNLTERLNRAQGIIREAGLWKVREERIYLERCDRIRTTLTDFERRVVPMFDTLRAAYYDSVASLHRRLHGICFDNYPAGFPADDQIWLQAELGKYYEMNVSEFSHRWFLRLRGRLQ
ncbi:MAG: hypothetical protein K2H15_05850 [Muribaculaceae bacterium]|nr:hypothetical protein [Muribaculaceae bacterium]